jgi:GxxExxY protein
MLGINPPSEEAFPHKDITEAVIGSAFQVHNQPGYGFLHRVYQRALQVELVRHNHSADLEACLSVRYKDVIVGDYDADVIVDQAVVIEIKTAPQYDKRDEAQLLNLLKATGSKLGMLINFGRYKVEYRRFIF